MFHETKFKSNVKESKRIVLENIILRKPVQDVFLIILNIRKETEQLKAKYEIKNSSLKVIETLLHFVDAGNPCNLSIAADVPMYKQIDWVDSLLWENDEGEKLVVENVDFKINIHIDHLKKLNTEYSRKHVSCK